MTRSGALAQVHLYVPFRGATGKSRSWHQLSHLREPTGDVS